MAKSQAQQHADACKSRVHRTELTESVHGEKSQVSHAGFENDSAECREAKGVDHLKLYLG